jgi:hypothetical protein
MSPIKRLMSHNTKLVREVFSVGIYFQYDSASSPERRGIYLTVENILIKSSSDPQLNRQIRD